MQVHSLTLTLASFSIAALVGGCKPAELDAGYVAAHQAVADAECCRANAYASATGTSSSIADEMNAKAEACFASLGGTQAVPAHLESAVPSGYESEYEYISKLSDSDRAKVESIKSQTQGCAQRANEAWDANVGL